MASTRRKAAAAGLAVIGIAGLSLAAAAQLNVTSDRLGAGAVEVTSCDPTVNLAYVVDGLDVDTVTVEGVDNSAAGCLGQTIEVTVEGQDAGSAVVDGTNTEYDFDISGLNITAEALVDVAVVIH